MQKFATAMAILSAAVTVYAAGFFIFALTARPFAADGAVQATMALLPGADVIQSALLAAGVDAPVAYATGCALHDEKVQEWMRVSVRKDIEALHRAGGVEAVRVYVRCRRTMAQYDRVLIQRAFEAEAALAAASGTMTDAVAAALATCTDVLRMAP